MAIDDFQKLWPDQLLSVEARERDVETIHSRIFQGCVDKINSADFGLASASRAHRRHPWRLVVDEFKLFFKAYLIRNKAAGMILSP